MPKHWFFDLDKTLTQSRTPMDAPHQEIFDKLCAQADVIVVSGGTVEQIREQVTPRFEGRYRVLAQSGNHALDSSGELLWEKILTGDQIAAIHACIETLKNYFSDIEADPADQVENRGAQISYSVVGFRAPLEKKYAFDPDDSKRAASLAAHPEELGRLASVNVEVTPAGSSSFNFIPAGKHKGYNVAKLLGREGWKKADCIYVGDALFPGGNDETVVGVIPTHAVKNPQETFAYIVSFL